MPSPSSLQAVLSRIQLTHATRPTPHGASGLTQTIICLLDNNPTCSVPSRHCRDARVYGHDDTMAMHGTSRPTPPPPPPPPTPRLLERSSPASDLDVGGCRLYFHDHEHVSVFAFCSCLALERRTREPSHGRGATDLPWPLTLGAQHLTRYNTWKKFVRATRPALV